MAAFLGILQTGQESIKTSQLWQEQRCLHGNITMHEFLEVQHRHSNPFSPSADPPFRQYDSASSAVSGDSCSILSLSDTAIASFSCATRCHI